MLDDLNEDERGALSCGCLLGIAIGWALAVVSILAVIGLLALR